MKTRTAMPTIDQRMLRISERSPGPPPVQQRWMASYRIHVTSVFVSDERVGLQRVAVQMGVHNPWVRPGTS